MDLPVVHRPRDGVVAVPTAGRQGARPRGVQWRLQHGANHRHDEGQSTRHAAQWRRRRHAASPAVATAAGTVSHHQRRTAPSRGCRLVILLNLRRFLPSLSVIKTSAQNNSATGSVGVAYIVSMCFRNSLRKYLHQSGEKVGVLASEG